MSISNSLPISLAISTAIGAAIGGTFGWVSAQPSGFAVWVMSLGVVAGAGAGFFSFVAGAIADRLSRTLGRSSRIAIVASAAALTAAATVWILLVLTNSAWTAPTVAGTFFVSACIAVAAALLRTRTTTATMGDNGA